MIQHVRKYITRSNKWNRMGFNGKKWKGREGGKNLRLVGAALLLIVLLLLSSLCNRYRSCYRSCCRRAFFWWSLARCLYDAACCSSCSAWCAAWKSPVTPTDSARSSPPWAPLTRYRPRGRWDGVITVQYNNAHCVFYDI